MEDIFTKVHSHGIGAIDLRHLPSDAVHMRPTELHLKEDGAKNNTPSFCIVMEDKPHDLCAYGQISLNMLTEALDELGYKIIKK